MYLRSAALAAGLLCLGLAAPASAQDPKNIVKEEISFKSFDGVLLKGTFYPSTKGSNSPVVMILHKLGSDRTKGDWEGLAAKLQAKGYAVLTFDFRGHGQSTTIADPATFWQMQHNQIYLNRADPTGKKKTISLKEFKVGYLPYLVNDIAAARHDLDNRNDNGQCNTSNIIVIGAEEGATLGFFWMVTEFYRPQVYKAMNLLNFGQGVLNNDPAGDDFAGAIWLSYRRSLGLSGSGTTIGVPYGTWATAAAIAPVRDRIPMWFSSGAKDEKGVSDARYLFDSVLHADKRKDKLELTSNLTVANTNLRGVALLGQANLNTDDLIEKFIDKTTKKRSSQSQKKRNASEFKPSWIEPSQFGFAR